MTEIRDDDLVLYYYRELPDAARAGIERALAESDTLRARYQTLVRMLESLRDEEPPARGPDYGPQVWQRIESRLTGRTMRWKMTAFAGALAASVVIVVLTYQAGRHAVERSADMAPVALEVRGPQRALAHELTAHFENAERLLVTVLNAPEGDLGMLVDEEEVRAWARSLLLANRLYRHAAEHAGERHLAWLLDQMEPVLVEFANLPEDGAFPLAELMRLEVAESDLIFRLRVARRTVDKTTL